MTGAASTETRIFESAEALAHGAAEWLSGLVQVSDNVFALGLLFAHPITGLMTARGGANSHMAVRAAELDLPAVIVAGRKRPVCISIVPVGAWSR